MKKLLALPLEDEEIMELCRILLDKDAEGALAFADARQRISFPAW
jgi:hypothetical protein